MVPSVGASSSPVHSLPPQASGAAAKPATGQSAPAGEPIADSYEASGVLRNLADGHYRGVADVRLRIVHAERIAAMQAAADAQAAQAAQETLVAGVNDALDAFSNTNLPADPPDEGAEAAITAFTTALGSEDFDPDAALAELEAALREALAPPPAPEPETVEAAPVVTGDEPATVEEVLVETLDAEAPPEADPVGDLISALTALFDEAEAQQTAPSVLPPLADFSGNGKAYARFLETYLAMSAPPPSEQPVEATPSLDAAA